MADPHCKGCYGPPEPDRARCAACAAKHRRAAAAKRKQRRADSLCLACARKAKAGRSYCGTHLRYYAARAAADRAAG